MLNDCNWYVAKSLRAAKQAAVTSDEDYIQDDARELTNKEMRRLKYDATNGMGGKPVSFLFELKRRIKTGEICADIFATTDFDL